MFEYILNGLILGGSYLIMALISGALAWWMYDRDFFRGLIKYQRSDEDIGVGLEVHYLIQMVHLALAVALALFYWFILGILLALFFEPIKPLVLVICGASIGAVVGFLFERPRRREYRGEPW